MQKKIPNYVTEIKPGLSHIISGEWNDLLNQQTEPTPFMRHEYLLALELSHSACQETGWLACVITLRDEAGLAAACLVYIKNHSYGEYVFDWAWADAYTRHGLAYYPKAIVSSAFTPVPGSRLLARNQFFRHALLQEVLAWCKTQQLSSLHLLFGSDIDIQTAKDCGLLERTTVQFHWQNPQTSTFEQYLNLMQQDKRKKIRQERKKVQQAGIQFRWSTGQNISQHDWDFFYSCYENTYFEHGNAPYLSRDFFKRQASSMAENWLLFIGHRDQLPVACSLIGLQGLGTPQSVAYGRYWGTTEKIDCLHFEACYYQPIEWCIQNQVQRFEGGAQGEHKMARGLLPVSTHSAHWLAHPSFFNAVESYLEREGAGMEQYLQQLQQRSPLKSAE